MDEIVGLLVDQIAKSGRTAAERRARAAMRVQPAPPAVAAAAPVAIVPPPAPADPFLAPSPLGGDSPFGGMLVPVETRAPVRSERLLGAFAGAGSFLAGFVLAEALAPPLALREPRDA